MQILLLLFFSSLVEPKTTKILKFQSVSDGVYTTEEWAAYREKIPHMDSFTACHWERLRFFSVRDS